jgi:hypothetical protein
MPFVFAGYFPKTIAKRDDWLEAPDVTEIWSVSECMSKGPADWITKWIHNDFWLFDTVALAESVIPPGERGSTRILAYRVWNRMFDAGEELEAPLPASDLHEPEAHFARIGFDAVGRSHNSFDCSPLSCNGGAATMATNEACLFPTLEEALAGAKEFSKGNWEPGPYWIVEVLHSEVIAAPIAAATDSAS